MSRIILIALMALMAAGTGCSFKRLAVNKLGNALAGTGTTFAADDDPELVKAALPFSLKLMEGLLAENPRHPGLLFAAASGFTQYSYAFVQQDAEELEDKDLAASSAMKERARRLYLRARNYGLRGLALEHPGLQKALAHDPKQAVRAMTLKDVPLLYWTAAAWGGAISLGKDQPEMVAELPVVEALMDRALELNETFNAGAIHTFMITYEMNRPAGAGQAAARARKHFDRAMALSRGQLAGPLVSLAEAVCVQQQDARQFKALLDRALDINADAKPEWRLENLVMQRRARWLLSRTDQLFLNKTPSETK
jgi:predicted anti-sigma-YlaC factor YlaD